MRVLGLLLAMTSLTACHQRKEVAAEEPTKPAAITYDGATTTDPTAKVAHGERLSFILGCKGCHGENLQGENVTPGDKAQGDMWASNITLRMANYNDAQFADFLRKGEVHDGRALVFMPIETFQYLSDADVAALTAYLRTVPKAGKETPPVRLGTVWADKSPDADFLPAKQMAARFRANALSDYGGRHPLGHYIAQTVCAECHNSELQGYEDFSPNLDIVGTYNDAELMHMFMTGEGKTKKDLGLMSGTARHRTAKMTQHEREELIGFLRDRLEAEEDQPAHGGERD
ncbi:c-type cytochrome [Sphingomonas jaspsi]|uniref:c-type cytochrome n=1 Tax=Sphingomonas jaspsi TaxID=392409 RepID=UPI0004B3722D|nr:cytochrome c [Sphingomonas jaspsi]